MKITKLFIGITILCTSLGFSQQKDIVEIASASKDHTTIVAAVGAAGLVETLKSEKEFTVFAPTNDAFAALPDGTVEYLLKPENKSKLQMVLTYHVVAGKLTASDVVDAIKKGGGKTSVSTVSGSPLTLMLDGNNVVIKDANGGISTVTVADLEASNGVIHVVDSVLLPNN